MESHRTEIFEFANGRKITTITDLNRGKVSYYTVNETPYRRIEMEASGFGPDQIVVDALAKAARLQPILPEAEISS